MDLYRTPDERFADLPGWNFQPRYTEVDGLRIHYIDEGTGPPVVLFHGEPTWGYLYRKMISPLVAAGYRVICHDHAGFGRSDKPTDRDWYSFDRHSEIATAVLGTLDLNDATAVVHDWGGLIGLRGSPTTPTGSRGWPVSCAVATISSAPKSASESLIGCASGSTGRGC